jgi:hypothetical protein
MNWMAEYYSLYGDETEVLGSGFSGFFPLAEAGFPTVYQATGIDRIPYSRSHANPRAF